MDEKKQTVSPRLRPDGKDPVLRRQRYIRRRERSKKRVLILIAVLFGILLLLLAVRLLLPQLHVRKVEIQGCSLYREEEIAAAVNISAGEEWASAKEKIAGGKTERAILAVCPYLDGVRVKMNFFKVTVAVEEKTRLMYFRFNDNWFSTDGDFRVLEKRADREYFETHGFLRVSLPYIEAIGIGSPIRFRDAGSVSTDYIGELLDDLEEKNLLVRVSTVDFTDKFNVSFVLDERCQVKIGKVADLDAKTERVLAILAERDASGKLSVDVSDPGRAVTNENPDPSVFE